MNIRQWASNDEMLIKSIDDKDKTEDKIIKVLGMLWDIEKDSLKFPDRIIAVDEVNKRQMLKVVAGIHDPLGVICPIMLESKLLIQELWTLKFGWDHEVPVSIKFRWNKWINDINDLYEMSMSGCISSRIVAKYVKIIVMS